MRILQFRFRGWVSAVAVSLSLTSPAWAQAIPSPGSAASSGDLQKQAKAQLELGVAAYQAQRFQEAIERFLAADRLVPNAALSFNVARAYERFGDAARALAYYRDFLRRAPGLSDANAATARARVAELEAGLMARGQQQLSIFSEPSGANLTIDGKPLSTTPWTGELAPGSHQLLLSMPGRADVMREVELPSAHALELRLALPVQSATVGGAPGASVASVPRRTEPIRPDEPLRNAGFGPWPWVTLGAGGAALLAAGAFELSRRSAESDAESPTLPQIAFQERIDAMHARQTTARALVAVGSALALAGGLLIWLDPARMAQRRTSATLVCEPHSCLGSFALRY